MKFKIEFFAGLCPSHIQSGNVGGSRVWVVGRLAGSFFPYPLDRRTSHGGWG